ncbi:MAG: hypothetical protein IJD14_04030, partial [Christensenellaceae bacterium]|nr:hypothetical protein [Christensenellaceae bacterium]
TLWVIASRRLRCPKNTSGFRFASCFSTAASGSCSLHRPQDALAEPAQRATLVGLIIIKAKV